MWVQSLGQEDPLEEGMATHSNILAWRVPWTKGIGRPWDCGELDMTDATQHAGTGLDWWKIIHLWICRFYFQWFEKMHCLAANFVPVTVLQCELDGF